MHKCTFYICIVLHKFFPLVPISQLYSYVYMGKVYIKV